MTIRPKMSPADDITKVALKLATDGPHKAFPTPRQVQLLFNGVYVARTTSAVHVWEHPLQYPQLYLPQAAFDAKHVREGDAIESQDASSSSSSSSKRPIGHRWTITVGDRSTTQAVAFATHLSGAAAPLAGLVKVDFGAMDQWLEESTPIFVHPKDPFRRVDVLASTRRVRVFVGETVVADAASSMHLYETGLPCRYYLPLTSMVDAGVLRPSATRTQCPYKGEAEYYSVEVGGEVLEDVVWYYNRPTLECAMVTGLLCFYNEKVDIELDGKMLERPDTHFGKAKPGVKPSVL